MNPASTQKVKNKIEIGNIIYTCIKVKQLLDFLNELNINKQLFIHIIKLDQ